jgi:hypothetical protein
MCNLHVDSDMTVSGTVLQCLNVVDSTYQWSGIVESISGVQRKLNCGLIPRE